MKLDVDVTKERHHCSPACRPGIEEGVTSLARSYGEQVPVLAVDFFERKTADSILETESIEESHDKLAVIWVHNE